MAMFTLQENSLVYYRHFVDSSLLACSFRGYVVFPFRNCIRENIVMKKKMGCTPEVHFDILLFKWPPNPEIQDTNKICKVCIKTYF